MWCKFFQEEAPNLLKIVQFVCSVPVSNAFVERIFSVMGNVWTDERNRLAVNTLKIVRVQYFVRGGFVGHRSRVSSKHLSSHLPVDGVRFLGGQKKGCAAAARCTCGCRVQQRCRPLSMFGEVTLHHSVLPTLFHLHCSKSS
ncbi:hypothetical protein TNCV_2706611 [Trichonephila clavipes]|nr:hypothetical protein TNCV_2706611 [Trichonephila clavipes]